MNDRDKNGGLGENKQKERIINEGDFSDKSSYQPTEDSLDDNNPPGGGSGVPDNNDD